MSTILSPKAVAACLAALAILAAGCSPGGGSGSQVSIQNKGSDTMLEIAQAWAEVYEDASVEVAGGGSGTGIAALIAGSVDIANCSRAVKDKEIDAAKKSTGKEPKESIVGYDALAVYVHKDCPIDEITIDQLKGIYGKGGQIDKWSQLGVEWDGCGSDEIVRVSRQNSSGTYQYFQEAVLGKEGEYKLGSIDQSGSRDLVELIGKTPCAIGYSGMGYKTDEVKFLKVKKDDASPGVLPSVKTVLDGSYPIARPLFMYTLGEPEGAVKAYLDWCHSPDAQRMLEDNGYVPLAEQDQISVPQ